MLTQQISLICARPHYNPGMYSVDLAFSFLQRSFPAVQVERFAYRPYPNVPTFNNAMRLTYRSLEENLEEVQTSDLIIYWGDFQHSLTYWANDLLDYTEQALGTSNREQIATYLARHLCLSEASDHTLARCLSFGSSTLGDDIRALSTQSVIYTDAIQRFCRKARYIWMRDMVSAHRVSSLRGDYRSNHLGTDCALLPRDEEYRELAVDTETLNTPYACIHFGRSRTHHGMLMAFATRLCQHSEIIGTWLPWLHNEPAYLEAFRSIDPDLISDLSLGDYGQLIHRLQGARFVITDTYHLALIAWRLGIPTVCIGRGNEKPVSTLSDKKKEVFHLQYQANPYYIYAENLRDAAGREEISRWQARLLQRTELTQAVVQLIDEHAAACRKMLVECIQEGL